MARDRLIGLFECAVLRSLQGLGSDAYGAGIARYLSKKLKREVADAQVYMALKRLLSDKFVRTEPLGPNPKRGGRSRTLYLIEKDGQQALKEAELHLK